jgi:sulfoxide reductase catalytic subunit YedY
MFIKRKKGWEIPDSEATPEAMFRDRRRFLSAGVAGAMAIGGGAFMVGGSDEAGAQAADPSAALYPARRNELYKLDRELTDEKYPTTFNNFYEYGTSKTIWKDAQKLSLRPWQVKIDGMVAKEMTLDIDDLLKKVQLEERLYRHRCVEAWSMSVPWTGFPMKQLVEIAQPTSGAKYVRMETFDPKMKVSFYPWPYVEGLTMEEAMNDLTLMGTGVYGKPLPKQMGAPLRLVTPWKYGFKSVKSIVRFTFTDKRPRGFWEDLQASEYGFWANVNPQVPHPRWSQSTEEVLGTNGKRVPTQLFNGYGEFVASMYTDKQGERLYM